MAVGPSRWRLLRADPKSGEKLAPGLERVAIVLLVLGEVVQDGSVNDETLF
jgi:hypothetical protein